MKKQYTLNGLDCASCAAKIEYAVQNLATVKEATLNTINNRLLVETKNNTDITTEIKSVVKKIEPDVTVSENGSGEHSHDINVKKQFLKLGVGAVILLTSFLMDTFTSVNFMVVMAGYIISYIILGGEVIIKAAKNIANGQVFDENFLMGIATIGAFIIGEYTEAVAVMLFYQIGEIFQTIAVNRSKKSITSLMDIRPDSANLLVDGVETVVDPENVTVGNIIRVKPGERVPLDGVIIDGESMLDTSALTGESVPRNARVGDEILSGSINQNGVLSVEVTKTFGQSTVSKIIDLVENASSKKAPTENFITTFSRYYTPAVVLLAALIAVVPPLFAGGLWADWINRGLIFLVISCPCALVVSIPLGFFGGIGAASRRGILVKGGNYLEALTKLEVAVFDKTGTLTKGVFQVTQLAPASGYTSEELLDYAANAEAFSSHPIALSVKKAVGKEIDESNLSDYTEIAGHGISVNAGGKAVLAGNSKLMATNNIDFLGNDNIGTRIYVAVDGNFVGSIVISDEIKEDSYTAITQLKQKNVQKIVMLTGDNAEIATAIGNKLELDEVYSELLPGDKVEIVERLTSEKSGKGKLAFVGDGINDAPVLARADIGIAMGGLGSDAAIEAADIVIMTDEPSKLAQAVDIAKATKRIVWQNIVFALGVKSIFLLFGALGYATMWEAVFADVGVAVIAIINATRVIKLSDKQVNRQ